MKIYLLLFCLLTASVALAQDDTTGFATAANNTAISPQQKPIENREKRFDIGGGVQVNSFGYMGTSAGPMFTARANSKYGRIAGVLTLSYNLNNNYDYYDPNYGNIAMVTNDYFISHVRYNFLRVSLDMQVPLFNRTNKKGFSISWIFGISYCNGLGSGEYKSGLDKPGAPSADSLDNYWGYQFMEHTQKFSRNNHNMEFLNFDFGLSFSYTFKRYQIYTDINYLYIGDVSNGGVLGHTFDKNYMNGARAQNVYPRRNLSINLGVRYCLYQPWYAKPPKRRNK